MSFQRKDFLGGALALSTAGLGLGAASRTQTPPKRTIFICSSLSFHAPNFFPQKVGLIESSTYLKKMRSLNKMTVFENFYHEGMKSSNHDSEKSTLTGAPHPESPSFKNTISIDQKLAETMGKNTRYSSLALGISDRGWGSSWGETGSAIPPIYEEQRLYDMLFGKEDLNKVKEQISIDESVIHCLKNDIAHLKRDKTARLRYESNLIKLEKDLEKRKYWLNKAKPKVSPSILNQDKTYPFSTRIQNLLNLSKEAFRTDSTRVISLSLEFIEGAIKAPGVEGAWHAFSHHNKKEKLLNSLIKVEENILQHLDQFLYDLDQIPEGKGSLLDHTTVVLTSNLGNANNHTHYSLPTLVAGGGYQHTGHVKFKENTPLCNLYLELLNHHGMDLGTFSTSHKNMKLLAT